MKLKERIEDIRHRLDNRVSPTVGSVVAADELDMLLELAESAVTHVDRCSQWECECSTGVLVNNWERKKDWSYSPPCST
jgi:hypothetical protein